MSGSMAAANMPLVHCGRVSDRDLAGSLMDALWVSRPARLVEILALGRNVGSGDSLLNPM